MIYGMKLIDQPVHVPSIELAGALLRAWARGDRPALEVELDRSSRAPAELRDTGESERLQMLNAIAARIKACADPFSAPGADPGMGVCVNLLSHLATGPTREEPRRAGWTVVRSASRSASPGDARSRQVLRGTLTLH